MPKPLLCVTVTAPTTAELRARRDATAGADLIELRLDGVRNPDAAAALAGRPRPVIVTCRPTWEGGAFNGSEEERRRILEDAIRNGAEYVDVEFDASFRDDVIRDRKGRGVIVSKHTFDRVPRDLREQIRAMRSTGAEVVKAAATPTRAADLVPLLETGRALGRDGGLVLVGMGDFGLPSRVLAGRFASMWTYAGTLRGIGQLSAASLVDEYRFKSITDATAIYGLAARSVGHSVSPAMHNAAFRAARHDAVYLPMPAESADDFVAFGKAIGLSGASVTIPFKVALFDRIDEAFAVARRVGAINTIRVDDSGRWIGGNTDASGFLRPLQNRLPLASLRASVLGAGGAARAVAVALESSGTSVRIHARDRSKAEQTARGTSSDVGPWPPQPGSWDLLVNCTPVGMYPSTDDTPVPMEQLTGRYVYDLIYNPSTTRLLRDAAAMGCQTIGGLEMLVAQADEQFQWWTGAKAPAGVMRDAARRKLAEFAADENYVV